MLFEVNLDYSSSLPFLFRIAQHVQHCEAHIIADFHVPTICTFACVN